MKPETGERKAESGYPKVAVGDIVFIKAEGAKDFIVITVAEHSLRVREWPLTDAPPAREVLRAEVCTSGGGDE